MSGFEVCKRLRQEKSTVAVPIIMLTAKGEEQDVIKGLELGSNDYITKPFSPKILAARARAACAPCERKEIWPTMQFERTI